MAGLSHHEGPARSAVSRAWTNGTRGLQGAADLAGTYEKGLGK